MNKTPLQATSTAQRAGPAVVPDAGNDFESFYRREHDGQVRRAYLLTGSPATAHDVVADAFVAVYRRWDRLDQPGPYLNRCVLNGCRAVHRRLRRRLTPLPADDRAAQDPAFDHPATELGDVLAALPFGQRAAVVLRFYGGFSSAEIATMLGCRPGTVRSQLHRGLRQLRMFLNEEEI